MPLTAREESADDVNVEISNNQAIVERFTKDKSQNEKESNIFAKVKSYFRCGW